MGFGLNLGTKLFTMWKGTKVGTDEYGNKYYNSSMKEGENVGRRGTERRWVEYNGLPEPSKVPPYWHGWLHHISDDVPTEKDKELQYNWQKPHIPNLTGTTYAYSPSDSFVKGKRAKAIGDYEVWDPDNSAYTPPTPPDPFLKGKKAKDIDGYKTWSPNKAISK